MFSAIKRTKKAKSSPTKGMKSVGDNGITKFFSSTRAQVVDLREPNPNEEISSSNRIIRFNDLTFLTFRTNCDDEEFEPMILPEFEKSVVVQPSTISTPRNLEEYILVHLIYREKAAFNALFKQPSSPKKKLKKSDSEKEKDPTRVQFLSNEQEKNKRADETIKADEALDTFSTSAFSGFDSHVHFIKKEGLESDKLRQFMIRDKFLFFY
jgi:hypothetical protein